MGSAGWLREEEKLNEKHRHLDEIATRCYQ